MILHLIAIQFLKKLKWQISSLNKVLELLYSFKINKKIQSSQAGLFSFNSTLAQNTSIGVK